MARLRPMEFIRRNLFHPLEAAIAFVAYGVFTVLPLNTASALGGWLAKTIGPHLGVSRRAVKNLRRVYPEMADGEIARIIHGMWSNLGRVIGEHPHLNEYRFVAGGNIELVGAEYIDSVREAGAPGIFLSAHLANWELMPLAAAERGIPVDVVYRAANNRMVDWLYRHGRATVAGAQIPKGPSGARLVLQSLRDGRSLGMVVDQKMNDGIPVPFFGLTAMTAPAAADLALRFGCPLLLARMERLEGPRMRLTVLPPIWPEATDNRQADIIELMTRINSQFESWIRERPEQWLWLHNRWPEPDDDPPPP
ncbi:MAG: lysophospholipid acyltransferase family protein [Rhodospirillales bacterium]